MTALWKHNLAETTLRTVKIVSQFHLTQANLQRDIIWPLQMNTTISWSFWGKNKFYICPGSNTLESHSGVALSLLLYYVTQMCVYKHLYYSCKPYCVVQCMLNDVLRNPGMYTNGYSIHVSTLWVLENPDLHWDIVFWYFRFLMAIPIELLRPCLMESLSSSR